MDSTCSTPHDRFWAAGIHCLAVVPVFIILSGLFLAPHASGENLLGNPGFETGDTAPEFWEFRSWNGTSRNANWGIDRSGRSGQCVTIRTTRAAGADAAWTGRAAVRPNTFYTLSGWIKTDNVQGATGALLNLQNIPVRTRAVTGTSDWTQVSTVLRTGPNTTEVAVNCLFGGWGSSTGQAWYDDIVLSPTDLSEQARAVVTVDADAEARPYSPMIFGGFIEHFGRQVYGGIFDPDSQFADEQGFRTDVIDALKELKLSVVRWPGGCFASGYHWKDGVGPERTPTPDPVWGDIDSNRFGTDEFVAWCRRVGCEPYICTNAGSGTPDEMAEWVEYCNGRTGPYARLRRANGHPEPLEVRYWSIGNENWGNWEIGASTPAKWGPLVRRCAELMLQVDPDLVLMAAATPNRDWTEPLLAAAGDELDYVCIHGYWLALNENNMQPDYLRCIMESQGPEQTLGSVIEVLEQTGRRGTIKIAFDEWNLRGWHHPGFPRKIFGDPDAPETARLIAAREKNAVASQYTMADALFSASFFNACLRHADDVAMANIAPIVNTRGPLYVYPGGLVKRTTYHVLSMYANRLGERVVDASVESGMLVSGDRFVPVVDALVTADEIGPTFRVVLVNRHPDQSADCEIRLKDRTLDGVFDAVVLSGDSPDAYNDIQHPDRVVPEPTKLAIRDNAVSLPPHSLTIITVP